MPQARKNTETLSLTAMSKLLGITEAEAQDLRRKKILVASGRGQVETVASIRRWADHMRSQLTKKESPPKYTSTDIAEWTGYTPRRIQQLIAEGILPGEENGVLSVKKNIHALIQYLQTQNKQGPKPITEARTRRDNIIADRQLLKLLQEGGQLVKVDDVVELWSRAVAAFRNSMISQATRITAKLPDTQRKEVKHLIEPETIRLLNDLSDQGDPQRLVKRTTPQLGGIC